VRERSVGGADGDGEHLALPGVARAQLGVPRRTAVQHRGDGFQAQDLLQDGDLELRVAAEEPLAQRVVLEQVPGATTTNSRVVIIPTAP
jgi:hypothetical protein